jgi:enoyl-CoA hydratase/carnithine racemase
MQDDLPEVWKLFDEDDDAWVAVVTGAGRGFCSGADMKNVAASHEGRARGIRTPGGQPPFTSRQNGVWKPVITAVNGVCAGGGLHFIADSDLVICSETASFMDTHVTVGLVAAMEPVGLTRRIPLEAILRMTFLGNQERMSPQRAYDIGLVSEVLPPDQLMPRALDLADKIAGNSIGALIATKKAIWGSLEYGLEGGLNHAWNQIQAHRGHPDSIEGPRAFAEKRKPQWRVR